MSGRTHEHDVEARAAADSPASRKLVCISLRGCACEPTLHGTALDRLSPLDEGFEHLCRRIQASPGAIGPSELEKQLAGSRATGVFGKQVADMFSWLVTGRAAQPAHWRASADGLQGVFRMGRWAAWRSAPGSLEGTEGDDLIVVIELEAACDEAPDEPALLERPTSVGSALMLLRSSGVIEGEHAVSERYRCGFYLVDAPANGLAWAAESGAVAYLFRCYLACQRSERLMLDVRVNGEWDEEFRKLLLVRKKLVALRKCALLKNRAYPGSALIETFRIAFGAFRLQEQIEHLGHLAEETAKVLEAQSLFVAARTLRGIQVIVFASTVLGLAVALNAIQMPPFYDSAATNALARPVFWWVIGVVVGAGIATWLLMSQGYRGRYLWREWRSRRERT
ncbi:MAG TPA: hypothetical protein VHA82_01765 [Ramlibacter sp.]|uniref:hypothetical protein n=1 Tax=Ramlibacter sp. TaxID=1917967 RepID=UPI002BB3BFD2|nr:hypothetical protein [Ramlibacter sp.]HVZ42509.1 hypothetical protein [Ramlibacter sp.]